MASSVLGFIVKKSADDDAEYGAFHVKSGSNIFLSNGWRTAHVKGSPGGFVYSSKPIPAGGMFQVKVLERGLFTFCIVSDVMAAMIATYNNVFFFYIVTGQERFYKTASDFVQVNSNPIKFS